MPDSIQELVTKVRAYKPDADTALIEKAYEFSSKVHAGQKRQSGQPYLSHPVEVALLLTDLKLDADSIAAALLHDTVEDTEVMLETIETEFNADVAGLVDGVTKLGKVHFKEKHVRQAETFRKMLLAMAQDIRVILIKLADRVHNMKTLRHLPEDKQRRIAQETLEIYAPLAHRLGIAWMKISLEDDALKYLKPMLYYRLSHKLGETQKSRDRYIALVLNAIKTELKKLGLEGEVSGRLKHYYSIYKKMVDRELDIDEIMDILAFRVIVEKVHECYEVLGLVHSTWKPVPGKFKDYIAIPKENMYQSLHTTVIGPEGNRIEVQIRTKEMHQFAEEGIAAHWMYKTAKFNFKDFTKFKWLRSMVEWEQDLKDSTEFYQTAKLDLFASEVYVFTPAGEVMEFPRGATPIDFAYRVHSEVGSHCVGARVNGKIVPLRYQLQNGDTIEIITSENQKPNKDWLKLAVTSKAKAKIRAYLRADEREIAETVGREVLEKECKKHGENYNRLQKEGRVAQAAHELNFRNAEALLQAIGYGKITIDKVLPKLLPPEKLEKGPEPDSLFSQILQRVKRKQHSPIKVGGLDGVLVRLGKCCTPLPGDNIVGYITRGRGVTVHTTDCQRVLEIPTERKVDVSWDTNGKQLHIVKIRVVSADEPGILAQVSKAISQHGGNISQANIVTTGDKKAVNTFEVEIRDRSQLADVLRGIEKLKGIIAVNRVRN